MVFQKKDSYSSLCYNKRISGTSLIDALIGAMIISIGSLGAFQLQINTLKLNESSSMRSQAVFLVKDISERIRANPVAALNGAYDGVRSSKKLGPEIKCINKPVGCNEAQIARHDIRQWISYFKRSENSKIDANYQSFYENGEGRIRRNGNTFTVSIIWEDTTPIVKGIRMGISGKKRKYTESFTL